VDAVTEDLKKLQALRAVPPEDIERLLALGEQRSYADGEVIFEPGEPCTYGLLLIRGRLSVDVVMESGVRNVGDIWPGEVAGESAFFDHAAPHGVRVTARAASHALVVGPELLDTARGTRALASMQAHLMMVLARRIRSTNLGIRKAWQEQRAAEVAARKAAAGGDAPTPEPLTFRQRLAELFGGLIG
jgi:CRP-like cAMP-binding protein